MPDFFTTSLKIFPKTFTYKGGWSEGRGNVLEKTPGMLRRPETIHKSPKWKKLLK